MSSHRIVSIKVHFYHESSTTVGSIYTDDDSDNGSSSGNGGALACASKVASCELMTPLFLGLQLEYIFDCICLVT